MDNTKQRFRFPFRLWRYILLDYISFFFVVFVFFIVIFIANQFILYAKEIFRISVPVFEVLKLFFYWLPDVITIAIPYATLVACLMSVGSFSSKSEFVAMRASGISAFRSFFPYLFFAIIIMVFSFFMNEVVLPWGSIQASKQYRKLLFVLPQLELEENSVKRYQDNVIVTKKLTDDGIDGLVIIDQDNDGNSRVISADSGTLVGDARKGVISLQLDDVLSVSREEKPQEYSYFQAQKLKYNLLVKDLSTEVQSITVSQKSITDLKKYIDNEQVKNITPFRSRLKARLESTLQNISQNYASASVRYELDTQLSDTQNKENRSYLLQYFSIFKNKYFNRAYQVHSVLFHKKLSEPIILFLFVCLAFPLGLFAKRSGRTIGFGMGICISFIYWIISILNQTVGMTNNVSAALVIWYPLIIIFLVSILLAYIKRLH